jgi:alkylation response protein AidB-like acyl-CoA dehydrogenase
LCLLRTNWDVPKHRGLSVFIIKIHQPGIELHRIEMINGSREFCQEFITDLRVPDSDRVGEVDQGWTVGTRWMFHEKNAMGGGSPFVTGTLGGIRNQQDAADPMVELAQATGRFDDPRARDLVGESYMLKAAGSALAERIATGMRAGVFPDNSAAIARLANAVVQQRNVTIALELAGPNAAASLADDPWAEQGFNFLERQTSGIGGGTTEMARNNISERVLGMPREITHDKNMPYRDVPKGPSSS